MYENEKLRPVETIPQVRGGELKDNFGGSEFDCELL
jgi:hypothetical protein